MALSALSLLVALEQALKIVKGDRVGVPWLYSAGGHCEHLSFWPETVCAEAEFGGYTKNGRLCRISRSADPNYVAHIPANLDPKAGGAAHLRRDYDLQGNQRDQSQGWRVDRHIRRRGGLGVSPLFNTPKSWGYGFAPSISTTANLRWLRSLVADLVVNAKHADASEAVKAGTNGGCMAF